MRCFQKWLFLNGTTAQVAQLGCHNMDQFSWGGCTKADHKLFVCTRYVPIALVALKSSADTGSTGASSWRHYVSSLRVIHDLRRGWDWIRQRIAETQEVTLHGLSHDGSTCTHSLPSR